MKVGDLVRPIKSLEGWEQGTESWIGLVLAVYVDALTGKNIATVRWNREAFQREDEYAYQLEVVCESR